MFVLLFILLVIGINFFKKAIRDEFLLERQAENTEKYIKNFKHKGGLVAYGDSGISITPIDAYIEDGIIYVKGNLKNNTGINIKFKDFGIVTADYKYSIFGTDYDEEKIVNNGEESKIVFSFGAYDVMDSDEDFPNVISFELGGYDLSNNNKYVKYDLKFYISWKYNYTY